MINDGVYGTTTNVVTTGNVIDMGTRNLVDGQTKYVTTGEHVVREGVSGNYIGNTGEKVTYVVRKDGISGDYLSNTGEKHYTTSTKVVENNLVDSNVDKFHKDYSYSYGDKELEMSGGQNVVREFKETGNKIINVNDLN